MIHGLLLINKEKNISSHGVVERVRRLFKIKKVGHFGTLDPFAEGLLLIGLGQTTKFSSFYMQKSKMYSGTIRFGRTTNTYDGEGAQVGEKKCVDLNQIELDRLLTRFTGRFLQTPPLFSAKKLRGKPLYKYARQNLAPEVKPVEVEIYQLSWRILDADELWFRALTSSGTYIRSLAHDIGQAAGSGAYLETLVREQIGEYTLADSVSLSFLENLPDTEHISGFVRPIETLLPEYPKIIVNAGGQKAVSNGQPLSADQIVKVISGPDHSFFRLFSEEGRLLSIAKKADNTKAFKPMIVFPLQPGQK